MTIQQTWAKFEADKSQLSGNYNAAIEKLESDYINTKDALNSKAKSVLYEAEQIHQDIMKLDHTLSSADKYYVKTKKKKEEMLMGVKSDKHNSDTDYFESLKTIREQYRILTDKYSTDILPSILNGINFTFSSKRKMDYEELIVLKNTVESLIYEINKTMPEITQDTVTEMDSIFIQGKKQLGERSIIADRHLAHQYQMDTETLAELICEQLDEILPDNVLMVLSEIAAYNKSNQCKINNNRKEGISHNIIGFLDYPLDLYVQSPILSSLIKDKCSSILVNNNILRFPFVCPETTLLNLMIKNDNSNSSEILNYMQSVMLSFLSKTEITKLSYSVFDPENRGNSISAFFELRKKLPELFDNKIFVSTEDINQKICNLNEFIDQTIQNRLTTKFETIYDYEKENNDYQALTQLLLFFNFPKGFDESSLSELRNVLRNGYKCGIYTLIYFDTKEHTNDYNNIEEVMRLIEEMCILITHTADGFYYSGLDFSYQPLPQKHEIQSFFDKYLLLYEGVKNKGIAFPAAIRKLLDAKTSEEVNDQIKAITDMMHIYEKSCTTIPSIDAIFPNSFIIGTAEYPMDIFLDSFGYESIRKCFALRSADIVNMSIAELPLTCDLSNRFNLFLSCRDSNSKQVLSFTHHIVWRFLSEIPVSMLNVCIIDCELRGNNAIPFLDFKKRVPDIFDKQILTSQDEISEKLNKLNQRIDELIQDKFGNKFDDILEYNNKTPKRAEIMTLLMIYDFPKGFDSRSIDLLLNIMKNGGRCGIYTIIDYNPNIQFSRYESIEDYLSEIIKYSTQIDYQDGSYKLLPFNLTIKIHPMSISDSERFIDEYHKQNNLLKTQGYAFSDILSPNLFSNVASAKLTIPIGVGDGDSIVNIVFGEGSSHHCMIAGATGSGKSTLLHTLIMSGMLHHSPDELHLYLMDFKSGTEFKIYESVRLPHIQLLALDAMQEFGESILEDLVHEMGRRSEQFKESGQTSLSGYTKNTGKPMPRILVIMDEFQILYNDSTNRKVAMHCAELTKRIVTEGRAFGIHLLMATQTTKAFVDLTLSHGTIEQMRIRIGLKCGEDDARYLFSDRNDDKALQMMKGSIGTAVMNLEYMESDNIGLRAAYCDDESQAMYLDMIAKEYNHIPSKLQIFEGRRTENLIDYFKENKLGINDSVPVQIPLGSLIKVAPPLVISVDRRRKHNLLICGANDRMSENITNSYMLSALMNTGSQVYCIDGEYMVGDSLSEDIYRVYKKFGNRFTLASERGQIVKIIKEVYSILSERKKKNENQQIFIFIKSLQFLDIVKKMFADEYIDESEFADDSITSSETDLGNDPTGFGFLTDIEQDSMSISAKLQKLIDDGSGFGILLIVSCAEYQVVKETMFYGSQILPKFPERIIFSLNDSDADNLIDGVSVSNLRENTVYFTDGIKNTFQLKPYIMPPVPELDQFVTSLLGGDVYE